MRVIRKRDIIEAIQFDSKEKWPNVIFKVIDMNGYEKFIFVPNGERISMIDDTIQNGDWIIKQNEQYNKLSNKAFRERFLILMD